MLQAIRAAIAPACRDQLEPALRFCILFIHQPYPPRPIDLDPLSDIAAISALGIGNRLQFRQLQLCHQPLQKRDSCRLPATGEDHFDLFSFNETALDEIAQWGSPSLRCHLHRNRHCAGSKMKPVLTGIRLLRGRAFSKWLQHIRTYNAGFSWMRSMRSSFVFP